MLVHDLAPLEFVMEEVDHAARLISATDRRTQHQQESRREVHSRAEADDLLLIRDFAILPVSVALHLL